LCGNIKQLKIDKQISSLINLTKKPNKSVSKNALLHYIFQKQMRTIKFLAFVFTILIFTSCEELQDVKVVGVDSFFLNKINTDGIEAEVKIKIHNPNSRGFSLYPSEFDIIFSGIRLGKARLYKRVHINANTEKVYTFKLKSKLEDLNIFDAMRLLNPDNLGKIEVQGDLKAGKFYVKKKFPVNYADRIKILK
jgi:LEA14-like dessication related protein